MGEVEVDSVELDYWDWVAKVAEKLTFARLCVIDHREISEEDISLLKVLYKPFYYGEYPLYQAKMIGTATSSTQKMLFDDKTSDCEDGTEIDNTVSETKEETE